MVFPIDNNKDWECDKNLLRKKKSAKSQSQKGLS